MIETKENLQEEKEDLRGRIPQSKPKESKEKKGKEDKLGLEIPMRGKVKKPQKHLEAIIGLQPQGQSERRELKMVHLIQVEESPNLIINVPTWAYNLIFS